MVGLSRCRPQLSGVLAPGITGVRLSVPGDLVTRRHHHKNRFPDSSVCVIGPRGKIVRVSQSPAGKNRLNGRIGRSLRGLEDERFCQFLLEESAHSTNNTSVNGVIGSSPRQIMQYLLGAVNQLSRQDKMSILIWGIGVAFAIVVLAWISLKIRSLFLEDEGPTGEVGNFLGQLRESQSEGVLTPEEYRSIQRRLLEKQMLAGDSTRPQGAASAKTADPNNLTPPVPYHDDADDHSP